MDKSPADRVRERLNELRIGPMVWLPADEDRWEAYLIDDEPPEFAFFCPACAEREFK